MTGPPFIRSVSHPTDFSQAAEVAFAHALAIALARQTSLTILNADPQPAEEDWQRFPSVRSTLERWGLLEPGSPRQAVFERFAVRVKKVGLKSLRPASAILDYLGREPTDLVVLASELRDGLPSLLGGSVSDGVLRESAAMTLTVPAGCRGFVDPADGSLSLRRILVPVAADPDPHVGVAVALRAADVLGVHPVEITALFVGEREDAPRLELPDQEGCVWRTRYLQGEVVDGILAASEDADLIVMATNGRSSLGELFRGSHTERVVRRARCPVLAVPEHWA